MPGYVIHLAESAYILDLLEKKLKISDEDKNRFLTGILLPDTKTTGHKRESHFWNDEELPYLAKKPDISIFLNKYEKYMSDPLVFGYYAHLELDIHFIDDYWANEFEFTDDKGNPEFLTDKVTRVHVKYFNETVPIKKFLSPEYYYGDYSRSNEYYLEKYHVKIPEYREYSQPIEEVDIRDMKMIFKNIREYCIGGRYEDIEKVNVFNIDELDEMTEKQGREAAKLYLEKYANMQRRSSLNDKYYKG